MKPSEYIKQLNKKLNRVNKMAQNPFLDRDKSYNPFENAFSQTYVWIEKNNKDVDESC